jgi:hypothetical protein
MSRMTQASAVHATWRSCGSVDDFRLIGERRVTRASRVLILRLAFRAIRWRAAASATVFVVAVVAISSSAASSSVPWRSPDGWSTSPSWRRTCRR